MSQVETINLSVPNPKATPRFSIPLYRGAAYNKRYKCWSINYVGGYIKFNLNLSSKRGVNLIFQLCSALVNGKSNCPITISVNGTDVASSFDPHKSNFYNRSWYCPQSLMKRGNNEIILKLVGGTTKVFIRKASFSTFEMQHQEQTNWCWSGVSTSVSHYYDSGSSWTQCSLVNAELGQTTCCQNGGTPQCNKAWYLDKALNRTGNLKSWQGGSIPVSGVQTEANATRPLGTRIGWSGGGGHFVVLTGVGNNQTMVAVQDPWYGYSYVSYSTFKNRYKGSGSWTHTYFTKK